MRRQIGNNAIQSAIDGHETQRTSGINPNMGARGEPASPVLARDFVAGEGTRAGAGPEKRAASGNPATLLG